MNIGEKLKKGDSIGVIAPASSSDKADIDKLERLLKDYGFKVVMGDYVYEQNTYLAGTDQERAQDLNNMFKNQDIDCILCIRGGYGTPRILDLIDYDLIRNNPKIFIGYSDITGIHIAINNLAGLVTYHGPMGVADMVNGFDPISREKLENIIMENAKDSYLENPEEEAIVSLVGGVARGELIGGNLSLLVDLIGTPYEVDTRGKILFIEEIGEAPRNIDRMLNQLRLSGKLDQASGIILGDFNNCVTTNISYSLDQVLDQYFAHMDKPVIKNFKAGHCEPMITLPFGLEVELDGDLGQVKILEDTVREA